MSQMKIIDHFAVIIQDMDGDIQELKSLCKPKIENGFLVVFGDIGESHFNLDIVRSWAFRIVDKE